MKDLKKIIALFIAIFIMGIVIIVININTSLKTPVNTVDINKNDTLYLIKKESQLS